MGQTWFLIYFELDFYCLCTTQCVDCKNLVRNSLKIKFVQLDFLKKFQTRFFKNQVQMDWVMAFWPSNLKFHNPTEKKTYATLYWQATPGMQPYTLGQQIRFVQKNQLNPKLHSASEIWILFKIFPNEYDNHRWARTLASIDKSQNDQPKSVSEGFFFHITITW